MALASTGRRQEEASRREKLFQEHGSSLVETDKQGYHHPAQRWSLCLLRPGQLMSNHGVKSEGFDSEPSLPLQIPNGLNHNLGTESDAEDDEIKH